MNWWPTRSEHDDARRFFEDGFRTVFRRIRDRTPPGFPISVFYAFKQAESDDHGDSSTGWETLLDGMIRAGWMVTGTWPLRTELGNRTRAMDSNALASSIVLACRPEADRRGITDRRGFLATFARANCQDGCGSCSKETSHLWIWRRRRSGRGWRYSRDIGRSPSRTARRCACAPRCS